jgi:hypothetical protein
MEKDKPQGFTKIIDVSLIAALSFAVLAWTSFGREVIKEMQGKGRER